MKTENEPQLFEHYLCRVDVCRCISENCLTTGQESKQPLFRGLFTITPSH